MYLYIYIFFFFKTSDWSVLESQIFPLHSEKNGLYLLTFLSWYEYLSQCQGLIK